MRRYVFLAGIAELSLSVLGESFRQEIWLGIEAEDAIDLAAFSREHTVMLIPAEHLTADELRSIGVDKFDRIDLDMGHFATF